MYQNNKLSEFIRENSLATQIGGKPVITGRGERLLQELSMTAARSNSELF